MNYLIWEADREEGQAIIYGGWPALEVSFSTGALVGEVPPIEVTVDERSQGELTDNLMVIGAPPIFSDRLLQLLQAEGVDNLQVFPCTIKNLVTNERMTHFHVVNVIGKVACIDHDNSELEYLDEGQDRILGWVTLTLDETRIPGSLMFVLAEMPVQIIVHERLARAIEDAGITGVRFTPQGDPMAGWPH